MGVGSWCVCLLGRMGLGGNFTQVIDEECAKGLLIRCVDTDEDCSCGLWWVDSVDVDDLGWLGSVVVDGLVGGECGCGSVCVGRVVVHFDGWVGSVVVDFDGWVESVVVD